MSEGERDIVKYIDERIYTPTRLLQGESLLSASNTLIHKMNDEVHLTSHQTNHVTKRLDSEALVIHLKIPLTYCRVNPRLRVGPDSLAFQLSHSRRLSRR